MNLRISYFVKIFNRRSAKHNWLTKGKQRSGKLTQMNADNKKRKSYYFNIFAHKTTEDILSAMNGENGNLNEGNEVIG